MGRRLTIAGALLVGLLALLAWHFVYTTLPTPGTVSKNRLPELKKLIEELEKESATTVASYAPESAVRLDDMTASAETMLRQLPGSINVEIAVRAEKPTHRSIHLRDWHFEPQRSLCLRRAKRTQAAAIQR
jgi:hypothetical protein